MNYFVIANGILYLAATAHSTYNGHYLWSLVWFCYAVSAITMFFMEV